jgi:apyrase
MNLIHISLFCLSFGGKEAAERIGTSEFFYSIVIDAGSKGSRLIIFRWVPPSESDRVRRSQIVIPETVGMKRVRPGLSTFALSPGDVRESLKSLIDYATDQLSLIEELFEFIPIYIKCTAGMRDLTPARRDAVMENSISFIKNYSPFYFDENMASVISGEEEGAYAWLSINALRGRLGIDRGQSTYGVIDLGGASLQIAFVPDESHYVLQNCYPLTLTDQSEYRLYSKSYLHYGIVEGNRRHTSKIITDSILKIESVSKIENPCYYANYEFKPQFVNSFPIDVNMTGTGDFDRCAAELRDLFKKESVQCWVRDCTFDGVYQPRLGERPFVGISNLGKFVNVTGLDKFTSLKSIKERGRQICSLSHDQVEETYPNSTNTKSRETLCFSLAYIYTLLTYGLGFTISDDVEFHPFKVSQIEFTEDEGNVNIDWALGAVVRIANQQPPATLQQYLEKAHGIDTSGIRVEPSETVKREEVSPIETKFLKNII